MTDNLLLSPHRLLLTIILFPYTQKMNSTYPTIIGFIALLILSCFTRSSNYLQQLQDILIMKAYSEGTDTELQSQYTDGDLKHKLQIQGECRIQGYTFLSFSIMKICLILPVLVCSIIGLLLLKHSKKLRKKVFYDEVEVGQASHILIKGSAKNEEQVILLQRIDEKICFYYKELHYQLIAQKPYPVCIHYQKILKNNLSEDFMGKGLREAEVQSRLACFGKNQHIVNAPNYFFYLYEVMTQPFFFIQYLAAVVFIIVRLSQLAFILIGSSLITTTINYILLYCSYKKIKEMAEIVVDVQTIRDGQIRIIKSNQLVPGDLIIPQKELYCDVILLRGQIYANEANLTGQSMPIRKYGVESYNNYNKGDNSIWIFEGSKILSVKNALAMVVHTGYASKKGRILRKMLHRTVSQPHLFKSYIYFLVQNYIACLLVFFATLHMRISNNNLTPFIIFLNFILIITFCFPPACPIYFNLIYSFSLLRMKFRGILGTYPQKTIESANLTVMCFDKTGTLTQDKVQVHKILKFHQGNYSEITLQQHSNDLDFKLFATCHTVKEFNNQLMGDQIDLKTFLNSGYKLSQLSQNNVCSIVQRDDNSTKSILKVLKIYPYESKFQSMSVLVYDQSSKKYYIFTKGAPEVIYKHALNRFQYFERLLQKESYSGFRTIGYAYRQIYEDRINQCLNLSRQDFLKNLNMMGILVFQNKLKEDAFETISLLKEANISSRMITGDNIYIAIQTAMRCGIIQREQQIKVLQGASQIISSTLKLQYIRFNMKTFRFINGDLDIQESKIYYNEYCQIKSTIIVDNNFLKLRDDIELNQNIKVFARISPQNKAFIVKNIKKEYRSKRDKLGRWQKMKSEQIQKVGMVGDGANDLLAIKQSDIGIGISNCDSSYAACFSITNLKDLDYIIRQSKSAEMQIIQLCRIISINGFLSVVILVIMQTEASFFSSFQIIFNNLTKSMIFPILLGLSRPIRQQTTRKPCSNFLLKENQLVHWGNCFFSSLAFISSLIYIRSTQGYVYNTTKATTESGWVSNNQLVSSQYLYTSLQPVIQIICIYQSSPWKEPIYKNIPLFIILSLNLFFQTALFFIYPLPSIRTFFAFVDISSNYLYSLFVIAAISSVLLILWTALVDKICLKSELCLSKNLNFIPENLPTIISSERDQIYKGLQAK